MFYIRIPRAIYWPSWKEIQLWKRFPEWGFDDYYQWWALISLHRGVSGQSWPELFLFASWLERTYSVGEGNLISDKSLESKSNCLHFVESGGWWLISDEHKHSAQRDIWAALTSTLFILFWPDLTHSVGGCNSISDTEQLEVCNWKSKPDTCWQSIEKRFERR